MPKLTLINLVFLPDLGRTPQRRALTHSWAATTLHLGPRRLSPLFRALPVITDWARAVDEGMVDLLQPIPAQMDANQTNQVFIPINEGGVVSDRWSFAPPPPSSERGKLDYNERPKKWASPRCWNGRNNGRCGPNA